VQPPIGLIAASGRLPVLTARGIRRSGRQCACIGLAGWFDEVLRDEVDRFHVAGPLRPGSWIRKLRRLGVREAVMIGRFPKQLMYDPLVMVRAIPDARALRLWYRVTRNDRRTDALLRVLADELAEEGIELIDSTRYISESMADAGVMSRRRPTEAQLADIRFGTPICREMGGLDIGQAIAVRDREVIAVEAIEGTDAMIERAGSLCRSGGWTLIKLAKPQQDLRLDVPTVGPRTVEMMQAARGAVLALESGKVILADRPKFLEDANKAGLIVVGVDPDGAIRGL